MTLRVLRRRDGSAEFQCLGCDVRVVAFNKQDTEPFCATCLFWLEWLDGLAAPDAKH